MPDDPLPPPSGSLFAEGHTVGASIHGGICFVSAYLDLIQRAVVSIVAMICALGNGALDALVCVTVHSQFLLLFKFEISMTPGKKIIQANSSYIFVFLQRRIDFFPAGLYNCLGVCEAPNYIIKGRITVF